MQIIPLAIIDLKTYKTMFLITKFKPISQFYSQQTEREREGKRVTGHRRLRNSPELLVRLGKMGFLVTSLIFVVVGIIASLFLRICCNRGPSTNLFHLTLVITATVCCWMMWAIVYLAQMKPLIVPILSEEGE